MSASFAPLSGPAPRDVFDQFDSRVDMYVSTPADSARLTSGYLCLKVLLMAANLVTLIFGIVLLAVASYALTSQVPAHYTTASLTSSRPYTQPHTLGTGDTTPRLTSDQLLLLLLLLVVLCPSSPVRSTA